MPAFSTVSCKPCRNGDRNGFHRSHQLIEKNLTLVKHIAGKLVARLPAGVDVENLESAGTLGLVEAAKSFDPRRGAKFETYSYTRIRGAMLDELRRNCPIPQHKLGLAARVRSASEGLPRGATVAQIAQRTGLSAEQVKDSLAALRLSRVLSLDHAGKRDPGVPDRGERPEMQAEKDEENRLVAQAIQALPERERLVVTLYFMEDLRLREIATVLGLSESRVSRLLNAALGTIGRRLRQAACC